MSEEKQSIHIADTAPDTEREFSFLVYAQIEFEVKAEDPKAAEEIATNFFKKLDEANKDKFLRVVDAKVADKHTGYFFRK